MLNKEEEREMAKEGKKWTARELIDGCGGVLDNFILSAIVKSAPSPNAADEYVQWLGWPNGVAKKVRNAVRLRDKFPAQWQIVQESAARLGDIFIYSPYNADLSVSEAINMEGFLSHRQHWPLVLREFLYHDNRGFKISSLDGFGRYPPLDETDDFSNELLDVLSDSNHESIFGHLPADDSIGFTDIDFGNNKIYIKDIGGAIVKMPLFATRSSVHFYYEYWPNDSNSRFKFLVPRKCVEISEKNPPKLYSDRIRIFFRLDTRGSATSSQKFGYLFFQRVVQLSESHQAVLTVTHNIEDYLYAETRERVKGYLMCQVVEDYPMRIAVTMRPCVYLPAEELAELPRLNYERHKAEIAMLFELGEELYYNPPRGGRGPGRFDLSDLFNNEKETLLEALRYAKEKNT